MFSRRMKGRDSPGIEREGSYTELVDDQIIRDLVLTEIELELTPIQALLVFYYSVCGDQVATADMAEVSRQRIGQALDRAREVAGEKLQTNSKFAECVRELGYRVG